LITLVLLVQLPAVYLIGAPPTPVTFIRYLYEHGWLPIYLHLWFLAHLLLYSAAFAAWREAIVSAARARRWSAPGHATIAGFVLALALVTWIVRLRYPVDKWVPLLWIMPAEPAHLPQYVALFATGITAHRGDWFRNMPTSTGVLWLGIGLMASAGIYLVYAVGPWNRLMAIGGFNWPSFLRSLSETVIATSLSIGLIVAFRGMFFRPSRTWARSCQNLTSRGSPSADNDRKSRDSRFVKDMAGGSRTCQPTRFSSWCQRRLTQ
jgi:glucans biosynthesis protein C